jgi:hypothetical protein
MITLNDLMCYDDLYYIGNIIDADGNEWVDEAEATQILNMINGEVIGQD